MQHQYVDNSWVACPRPNPRARRRLFCFPFAGAGAAAYWQWPSLLPAEVELCSLRLPGRENRLREPPCRRLDTLVEALVEAVGPHLELPFAFFGHSMGALIAFELARALRRRQLPMPSIVLVSGRRPPHLPERDPPLHPLPDSEFVAAVARRYNGIPASILHHAELLSLFVPILRADLELVETYTYRDEPPLDCPLSAFGGRQDDRSSETELGAWRLHTRAPFSLRMFPGDHFFLQTARAPLVQEVVRQLKVASNDGS
jgi:medium-chain acyl-[acyl-carrier-protein] hydrolase